MPGVLKRHEYLTAGSAGGTMQIQSPRAMRAGELLRAHSAPSEQCQRDKHHAGPEIKFVTLRGRTVFFVERGSRLSAKIGAQHGFFPGITDAAWATTCAPAAGKRVTRNGYGCEWSRSRIYTWSR